MDWGSALVGVAATACAGVIGLAFKNQRVWSAISEGVTRWLAIIASMGLFTGCGLVASRMFPEQVTQLYTACFALGGLALGLLLVLGLADWIRQP